MEVWVGGRGGAMREVLMGMRSSTVRGSEVIGSVPWVEMWDSMRAREKTLPGEELDS